MADIASKPVLMPDRRINNVRRLGSDETRP